MTRSLFVLSLLLLLVACSSYKKPTGINLQKYDFSELRGWESSNITSGLNAFRKSCAALYNSKMQSERVFAENNSAWNKKCSEARKSVMPKQFFEQNFLPYLVTSNSKKQGVFTGYYEKEIEASFKKDKIYKYPIYKTPSDQKLLNLTRRQIENGALSNKGLEIAYAKSAAKLFFLQIQGSGILKLPSGRKIQIGFDTKNNQKYTGIGSYMLQHDLIQHGTAEEIIQWLEKHPVSARNIMNMNDRYVFFSLKNGGPYGSLGVELTDQASIAVDPYYIPLGLPVWVQTTLSGTGQHFTKLMNAQDTGSAIKGPIRADIFFGKGDWAARTASGQNSKGNYFILLPKEINPDSYF